MKIFKTQNAYLVGILILSIFISSSLVYGGSDGPVSEHKTPNAVEVAALYAAFSGAGIAGQEIDTLANGNIGTTAASPVVTGHHEKRAGHTETTYGIGTTHRVHPSCQDSCSL